MMGPFEAARESVPARVELLLIWILLALTWITIALRFYVRAFLVRSLGWDDGFMLITSLCFTLYCVFIMIIISRGGFTKTNLAVTIPKTITYVMLSELFYVLTTIFLKIALALFFLRILIKPWQRTAFYIVLVITTTYGALYAALAVFQCGLPDRLMHNVLRGHGCVADDIFLSAGYTYAALNIAADWTFVIIPLLMLRNAGLDKRSKFSVAVIMLLGTVGSVAGAVRVFYMKGLIFSPNFFYDAANITIWSTIEPGTAIVAGSLATLRPLLRLYFKWIRGNIADRGQTSGSWNGTHGAAARSMTFLSHQRTNSTSVSPFDDRYDYGYAIPHGFRSSFPDSSSAGEKRLSHTLSGPYPGSTSSGAEEVDLTNLQAWDEAIDEVIEEQDRVSDADSIEVQHHHDYQPSSPLSHTGSSPVAMQYSPHIQQDEEHDLGMANRFSYYSEEQNMDLRASQLSYYSGEENIRFGPSRSSFYSEDERVQRHGGGPPGLQWS